MIRVLKGLLVRSEESVFEDDEDGCSNPSIVEKRHTFSLLKHRGVAKSIICSISFGALGLKSMHQQAKRWILERRQLS